MLWITRETLRFAVTLHQGTGTDLTGGTLNVNVTSEEDVFVEKIGNLSTPVLCPSRR